MKMNPLNLALRFILELTVLFVSGLWAWKTQTGIGKYSLVVLLPLGISIIWGVFAVPNDPSRSGKTVVKTNGILRLLLELIILGAGYWFLSQLGFVRLSYIYMLALIIHYLVSYKRVLWLLRNGSVQ